MSGRKAEIYELATADQRYAPEAYEFLCNALSYTQKALGVEPRPTTEAKTERKHVSGQQLLEGIRDFALQQYGRMAYIVFDRWGVHSTADFGHMVYRLIEAGFWHKSDDDRIEHFQDLYDFHDTFVRDYRIEWEDD
jgi:uncharacterized repeat protein (TIGR04138 family)